MPSFMPVNWDLAEMQIRREHRQEYGGIMAAVNEKPAAPDTQVKIKENEKVAK